jgi:hypothetical protein
VRPVVTPPDREQSLTISGYQASCNMNFGKERPFAGKAPGE